MIDWDEWNDQTEGNNIVLRKHFLTVRIIKENQSLMEVKVGKNAIPFRAFIKWKEEEHIRKPLRRAYDILCKNKIYRKDIRNIANKYSEFKEVSNLLLKPSKILSEEDYKKFTASLKQKGTSYRALEDQGPVDNSHWAQVNYYAGHDNNDHFWRD